MDYLSTLKAQERAAMEAAALNTAFEQAKMNVISLECLLESAFDKSKYNKMWAALVSQEVNKDVLLINQNGEQKKNYYLPKFRERIQPQEKSNFYFPQFTERFQPQEKSNYFVPQFTGRFQPQEKTNYSIPQLPERFQPQERSNYGQKQQIFSPPPAAKSDNHRNQNFDQTSFSNVTRTTGFFPGHQKIVSSFQKPQQNSYTRQNNYSMSHKSRPPLAPIAFTGGTYLYQ